MPRPAVVLVRPRDPNNIGAAARALANFGFDDLRVVAPHPPVWRDAKSAVGAQELLRAAKVYGSLPEALADRRGVWATSCLKARRPAQPVRTLPGFALGPEGAVVFGPEKTGLGAEDLRHCDGLLRVPTVPACPSMNLAQAVAVVCCALCAGEEAPPARGTPREEELLPWADAAHLLDAAEPPLALLRWRPELGPEGRRRKLEGMMRRRGLTREEARLLFFIARGVPRFCSMPPDAPRRKK